MKKKKFNQDVENVERSKYLKIDAKMNEMR